MIADEIDLALLNALQTNSKQTTKALASQMGLSVTAVYERIRRLEKKGLIQKYVALIDKEKLGKGLSVFCHIRLNQHIQSHVEQFEREVRQLDEVSACFHIGGEYDYILEIHVADMAAYREFMVSKLTAINNIGSTQSSFVINEVKKSTRIAL